MLFLIINWTRLWTDTRDKMKCHWNSIQNHTLFPACGNIACLKHRRMCGVLASYTAWRLKHSRMCGALASYTTCSAFVLFLHFRQSSTDWPRACYFIVMYVVSVWRAERNRLFGLCLPHSWLNNLECSGKENWFKSSGWPCLTNLMSVVKGDSSRVQVDLKILTTWEPWPSFTLICSLEPQFLSCCPFINEPYSLICDLEGRHVLQEWELAAGLVYSSLQVKNTLDTLL